jgi:hypothetical protein
MSRAREVGPAWPGPVDHRLGPEDRGAALSCQGRRQRARQEQHEPQALLALPGPKGLEGLPTRVRPRTWRAASSSPGGSHLLDPVWVHRREGQPCQPWPLGQDEAARRLAPLLREEAAAGAGEEQGGSTEASRHERRRPAG